MQQDEFDFIAGLLKQRSGLSLSKDKVYLLDSRLQPVARGYGFQTVGELIHQVRARKEESVIHDIVQAMTTNETMFFRDNKPFEKLKERVLPYVMEKQPMRKHLRIWSAACSSGQEPYTIAMCLQEEAAKTAGYKFDIIATDLCEKVVDKASQGLYSQFEIQRGLPIQFLLKYFQQAPDNQWRVGDPTKNMIKFQTHNLLEDCTKFGKFDIIFCRNVLIYFDEVVKRQVLDRLAAALNPPGILMLGSAETVFGLSDKFQPLENETGIYTLKI